MSLSYFKSWKYFFLFLVKFIQKSFNLFLLILIFFICIPSFTSTYGQFDSLFFQKHLYPYKYGVVALGDQNSDGCDDILVYDCNENKVSIFFGGSPMDTIPELVFHIIQRSIVAVDVNGDAKKDIVITYQDVEGSNQKGKVNIYYGGGLLDTIPDIHFEAPEGDGYNFGYSIYVIKDFDGNNISELMIYDADYPFSGFTQYGKFYIYNAIPFDTIASIVINGDIANDLRLWGHKVTTGDLDNDGLTDLAITGDAWSGPTNEFIKFYKGNSAWNTEPFVTFYKNEHSFDPTRFRIIEDINGDDKDDILISSYGNFYEFYYLNSILYGIIPIDTIPDVGLNTQNDAIINIALPGDVNGDGYNDLLAGTTFGGPEQARLWIGGGQMPEVPKQYYGGDFNGYGKLIARVGDVNGDGLNDICVGQCSVLGGCIPGFINIFAGDTLYQQPVSVKEELNTILEGFQLYEPYPNPFNPGTVISYRLTTTANVKITVYDILGNEIAVLVDEQQTAGEYKLGFDGSGLTSGIYFYQLRTGIFMDTKKMVLQK